MNLDINKPYRPVTQRWAADCAPTSAATVVVGEWGGDEESIADLLRRAVDARSGHGVSFPQMAAAIREELGVPAVAIKGASLSSLSANLIFRGGVLLGVRPSVLYAVPESEIGHAMVIVSGSKAAMGPHNGFIPPITLCDPHPRAPRYQRRVSEVVHWAYRAAGSWSLWVPSPREVGAWCGCREPSLVLDLEGEEMSARGRAHGFSRAASERAMEIVRLAERAARGVSPTSVAIDIELQNSLDLAAAQLLALEGHGLMSTRGVLTIPVDKLAYFHERPR